MMKFAQSWASQDASFEIIIQWLNAIYYKENVDYATGQRNKYVSYSFKAKR